jgi:hypothetical protein
VSRLFAGDRRVWLVAGGTLGALLVGVLVALAIPRDSYFTGSNSITTESVVADARPGERLCVPDLHVPAGTGRVRIAAFWPTGATRRFEGTLDAGGRALHGRTVTKTHRHVDIPVARLDRDAPGARFCVRAFGGTIGLGGKKELVTQHRSLPTLGRHKLPSEIAVWFLPPRSEKRSALSLIPDALSRAALFRPGIVGPWTYALLLFLLIPALCVLAIRMLAVRVAGTTRGARTALTVGAVAFACAATWALLTPPLDAPDEPEHFAYAQSIAETGKAPQKAPAGKPPYSSSLSTTISGLRLLGRIQQDDERPPWRKGDQAALERRLASPSVRGDDGGGYLVSTSTHAPPYYALEAVPYLLAGSKHPFTALTLMRFLSALLGGLTAAFAFLTLRELFPRHEWLAAAGGLLVAFQPMFGFISGSVNNDNGVNAAAALLLLLLVRGLRRGVTLPLGLGIGATMVVLPLMKGTGYALLPAVLVALVGMAVRRHGRRDVPGYAALAGAFVGLQALWSVIAGALDRSAYTTPGGTAPVASNGLIVGVLKHPGDFINYTWQVFLPRLPFMKDVQAQRWPAFDIYVERGWAAFGWYAMKFPHAVYLAIAAVMLLAGALCVVAVWRERPAARRRMLELAVLVLAIAGVVAGVEATYQAGGPRTVVPEQGRYAFTAMVPLAAIAVGSGFAFGRRRAPLVAAGLVAAVAGLAVASYMLALTRFFM